MKASDLTFEDVVAFDPERNILNLLGERGLIFDALSLGLLRKQLILTFGEEATRTLFTGWGYAQATRLVEALRPLPWDTQRDWHLLGVKLVQLQGMIRVENIPPREGDVNAPFGESLWHNSFEGEMHVAHLGLATEPVCWFMAGLASGHASTSSGRAMLAREVRCIGRGDPVCHVVIRSADDWGAEAEELARYLEIENLPTTLGEAAERMSDLLARLGNRASPKTRVRWQAPDGFVAESVPIRRVVDLARRSAKVDSTILITGESGSGKELIARLIHDESARAAGPFLAVNCGALSGTLLESELFGHARGAFTGASRDRIGLLEAASQGTLFLDEVGELTLDTQVRLLRALQEREITRVGETHTRPINVRVVAATHRDLADRVNLGKFRQDLYYRLAVVEIRVPPLRDRREDILPLARVFLRETAERYGEQVPRLTPEVADGLLHYEWPGNVRELQNAMERAVVLGGGPMLRGQLLPESIRPARDVVEIDTSQSLAEMELAFITRVFNEERGNRRRTAQRLGIGTATLYRKLQVIRDRRDLTLDYD